MFQATHCEFFLVLLMCKTYITSSGAPLFNLCVLNNWKLPLIQKSPTWFCILPKGRLLLSILILCRLQVIFVSTFEAYLCSGWGRRLLSTHCEFFLDLPMSMNWKVTILFLSSWATLFKLRDLQHLRITTWPIYHMHQYTKLLLLIAPNQNAIFCWLIL